MNRDKVTEMPELWRVYELPLYGTQLGWFFQFDVPTEVVIGQDQLYAERYPHTYLSPDWRCLRPTDIIPRQGREYQTVFKLQDDGAIAPWWAPNDYGKGKHIVCQEIFEDHGDDGHTEYRLIGFRYVPSGTSPWAVKEEKEK